MEPALKLPEGAHAGPADRPPRRRRDRRGRLLHGYLHKTSNSLCGIKGYASLIAARSVAGDGDRDGRWARKIIAEVERLEAIYRSVQDMAFPEPPAAAGGDLTGVLARAAERATRRHRNLVVAALPDGTGELLMPDCDLELILAELLANCAEGNGRDDPGRVTVRLGVRRRTGERGEGRLVLSVGDDGRGLLAGLAPEEAIDPFVTTKDGRLGVGLARVDTIAEMYGLAWSLASVPGMGTVASLDVARTSAGGAVPMAAEGSGS
ncbi:MAG: ATP-binding protein [Candidatus Krumholzibacteriia bacterium]